VRWLGRAAAPIGPQLNSMRRIGSLPPFRSVMLIVSGPPVPLTKVNGQELLAAASEPHQMVTAASWLKDYRSLLLRAG